MKFLKGTSTCDGAVHGNTGMDGNGPEWTETDWNGLRNGSEWTVKWTGMDTGTDPNGQWNGPERTGMGSGMDRNGPEDTMKSLALHPFSIHVMFS